MGQQFRAANRAKMSGPTKDVSKVIKKTKTKAKEPRRRTVLKEIRDAPKKSVGKASTRGKSDMGKAQRAPARQLPKKPPQSKPEPVKKRKRLGYVADIFLYPERKK